jgi:hypothetical protein
MVDFLRREKVNVVIACDLERHEMVGLGASLGTAT